MEAHAAGAEARTRGGLIGSPETIRQRLRKFEASNIDQVILLNQAGKNTHEDICASLELFAARGDARVPRARAGAPGVEGGACSPARSNSRRSTPTPYNFAARGKPTQTSTKQTRNMVAGTVGRPNAESLG